MSSDLNGCFELKSGPTDPQALLMNLGRFGITFRSAASRFAYTADGYLSESPCPSAGLAEFSEDMNRSTASLNGTFDANLYQFTLGFFAGQHGQRFALFGVAGSNIQKMSAALEAGGGDFLEFLAELRWALSAESLALGFNVDYPTLLSFLRGELPLSEVDEYIRTAINAPPLSEQMLRDDPATRELHLTHGTVLSRWLPVEKYRSKNGVAGS